MNNKPENKDIDASIAFNNLISLQQFSKAQSLRQLLVLPKDIGSKDSAKSPFCTFG